MLFENENSSYHCLMNDCAAAKANFNMMTVRNVNYFKYCDIMKKKEIDLNNYDMNFELNEKKISANSMTDFRAVITTQKNQNVNIFEFVLELKTSNDKCIFNMLRNYC